MPEIFAPIFFYASGRLALQRNRIRTMLARGAHKAEIIPAEPRTGNAV
jgi:hypothetical protein